MHTYSRRFETLLNYSPELVSQHPKLSQDIVTFLGNEGEVAEDLIKLPIVAAPVFDDSFPLASYFVSTSHNTYLLGDQLWGKASPSSYTHVIANGAHCVEIDVWPGHGEDSEPIVTHGYTLAGHIPFRDVCAAINEAVEKKEDDWPIFISLECHVGAEGQPQLINILKETWGDKLVQGAIEGIDIHTVTPRDLKNRIVMMIEYYPADAHPSEPDSENEDQSEMSQVSKISDDLAQLGVYARSMKPSKHWLAQDLQHPFHVLINISESALSKLIPLSLQDLIANGRQYLRRVYPRGTRIESGNLNPLLYWQAGSHFSAINWQEFDRGMQLNEAMFVGTPGWVMKPRSLLGEQAESGKTSLRLEIAGLSALPRPKGKDEFTLHVKAQLIHSAGDREWKSRKVDCQNVSEEGADVMFNEHCEWVYENDDLAFVRILIMEDRELKTDRHLGIFCARVMYIKEGWRFIRLLDTDGKGTHATLLVKFTIANFD